jgi:hypothetical protein
MSCSFFERLAFWAPCIFWLFIPCQMYSWQRFSPFLWTVSSSLVTISFAVQKLFSFMQSHLSVLCLKCWAYNWSSIHKVSYLCLNDPVYSLYFSWSNFSFDLILRTFIHFELIVVQSERLGSGFNLLQVDIHFFQLCFLQYIFWSPLSKIKWPQLHGFVSGSFILFY